MAAKVVQVGKGGLDAAPVELAVSALVRGELVALPTETVYGIAARVDRPQAIERLRMLKSPRDEVPFTLHLAEPGDAPALTRTFPPMARRLAARYWPGPLTLVLPAAGGGTVGLRVPARDFTRAVIRASGVPLYLTSANFKGEPPLWDAREVATRLGSHLDWIFDGGPSELREASTVVKVMPDRFEVLRSGILTEDQLAATAGRTVLFVCTGNTCRSPMAAAWLAQMAALAIGCTTGELRRRGLIIGSAGLSAAPGDGASEEAFLVMQEKGIDMSEHRTRPLTAALVEGADRIFVMTAAHLDRVLRLHPAARDKTRLLAPDLEDVPDPFGAGVEENRQVRDLLWNLLQQRLPEIISLVRS